MSTATRAALISVLAAGIGCSGPSPAAPPATELATTRVERDGVTLRAAVLDRDQARRTLRGGSQARRVLPVVFRIDNGTPAPLLLLQDDFTLRVDERPDITPVLPGRGAALLRDASDSSGWTIAGYLVLGVFAAPGIHSAERREDAVVEANRATLFREATVAPGSTLAGYLLFECADDLDEFERLELGLARHDTTERITLPMTNPYTD